MCVCFRRITTVHRTVQHRQDLATVSLPCSGIEWAFKAPRPSTFSSMARTCRGCPHRWDRSTTRRRTWTGSSTWSTPHRSSLVDSPPASDPLILYAPVCTHALDTLCNMYLCFFCTFISPSPVYLLRELFNCSNLHVRTLEHCCAQPGHIAICVQLMNTSILIVTISKDYQIYIVYICDMN